MSAEFSLGWQRLPLAKSAAEADALPRLRASARRVRSREAPGVRVLQHRFGLGLN